MIKLKVVDDKEQHFLVFADQPMHIEVSLVDGKIIAHVYQGIDVDPDQDPCVCYDGTLDYNGDWIETGNSLIDNKGE